MKPTGSSSVPRWLAASAALAWRFLVVVGAFVVLSVAVGRLHLVILPLIGALFLSALLVPPARWLRRLGLPALAATWIVFLCGLGVLAGFIAWVVPSAAAQFPALAQATERGADQAQHWLTNGPLHLSHAQLQRYLAQASGELRSKRPVLLQGALGGIHLLIEGVAAVLLTAVVTFFFVKDGDEIGRWLTGLTVPERMDELRAIGRRSWDTLGSYLRGTAVNGAVNALILGIGLMALRVPLVGPITLITFIGGFIPLAGGIGSGLLAAVVALAARGVVAGLVVLALTVVIHHVEGYLVGPLVLGRAVHLHPVAILLALTVGTILGGVVGTFLAVPALAVLLGIISYYRNQPGTAPEEPGTAPEEPGTAPEEQGAGAGSDSSLT